MSDELATLKAEATEQPRTVVFRDRKFDLAPAQDWVMDFLHYTDREKITLALEVALGPEQYASLRAMTPRPKLPEYMQLLEQIGSSLSLDMGEA